MNTEEQQKRNAIDNINAQKEAVINDFKRTSRTEALRVASSNKPVFYGQGLNQIGQGQQQYYDLLSEAEKIYQWLIKDL